MNEELLTVDQTAAALGKCRSLLYEAIADGRLESIKLEDGSRRVTPEAVRRYRARELPLAVISESFIDGERVRVAVTANGGTLPVIEVRVARGEEVQAITFSPRALLHWRAHLNGNKVTDTCWRYGVILDPTEKQRPTNPRPLPVSLSSSDLSEDPVVVSLVKINSNPHVEVRVGRGSDTRAVSFSPQHLNEWRRSMSKAALIAWRAGALGDEGLNL